MELSYQNGQKLVEESLLACGDEIRMRIRSFLVAEKQSLLAPWLVFFVGLVFFFHPLCGSFFPTLAAIKTA